jgi:hypothetical protein
MNQTVDNAIGGYDDTENKLYQRYLVPMPTEELSRRADLSQPTLLKRVPMRTSDSTSELCGGYIEPARNTVPLNGGTTQYAEASALANFHRTSRDGLGDSCEHGTEQVAAQNIAASRITPEEIRMLLEPSMYPRPKADRRVYPIKNKGKDKPINHANRRRPQ